MSPRGPSRRSRSMALVPRMSVTVRFGLISALIAACAGSDTSADQRFTVEDSAGVRIVRNGSTGSLPAAALDSPEITLRIGAVEGAPELQFFRIFGVAEDIDGNIWVLDTGHAEVRVFDAAGRHVRTFGRQGSGPGEFRMPTQLMLMGDTVLVGDGGLNRFTLFDRQGGVLGTFSNGDRTSGQLYPVARTEHGWIVQPYLYVSWPYQHMVEHRNTTRLGFVASIEAALPAATRIASTTAESGFSDPAVQWRELLRYPGVRRFGINTSLTMTATDPLFEPEPRHAVDGLGRIHFTAAMDYVIDTYDTDGRHVRRLTRAYTPVPVDDALVSRFADRVRTHWDTAAMVGEAELGKANDEARLTLPHVPTLPPIGGMVASGNGSLWVERIDLVEDPIEREWTRQSAPPRPGRWDLFDPDGRFLGTVTLPARFTPRFAGDRWMLGVLRDELDVQYVVRFEVRG